jgi:hypothetical protein
MATMPFIFPLVQSAVLLGAALASLLLASPGRATSLNDACTKFSTKLNAAQASGDIAKAKTIYIEGNKRIAQHFNGATCPNVKAP